MSSDYVNTNIGPIPVEDYKEIVAQQHGFDSYQDLLCAGFRLSLNEDRALECPLRNEARNEAKRS